MLTRLSVLCVLPAVVLGAQVPVDPDRVEVKAVSNALVALVGRYDELRGKTDRDRLVSALNEKLAQRSSTSGFSCEPKLSLLAGTFSRDSIALAIKALACEQGRAVFSLVLPPDSQHAGFLSVSLRTSKPLDGEEIFFMTVPIE
jgi:hypothetical protein